MQRELAKTFPKLIPNKLLHLTVHDAVMHTLQSNKTKKRRAQTMNQSPFKQQLYPRLYPQLYPFQVYSRFPVKYKSTAFRKIQKILNFF